MEVCLAVPLLDAETPIADSAYCVELVGSCRGCPSEALWVSGPGADSYSIRCAMWDVVLVAELVFRHRPVWVAGSYEGKVWFLHDGVLFGCLAVVVVVSSCGEKMLVALSQQLVVWVVFVLGWCHLPAVQVLSRYF